MEACPSIRSEIRRLAADADFVATTGETSQCGSFAL
jgi:hypothetical protein